MLLAADGDYRKVNGTTTRALRFVSILKSHHSSNRSHQGHGKCRKASGRSCLSAFATACTTAERTSAGICATAASSRYAEASARCLSARSRRSGVRQTTLDGSIMARQTVRCGDIGRLALQLPSGEETIAGCQRAAESPHFGARNFPHLAGWRSAVCVISASVFRGRPRGLTGVFGVDGWTRVFERMFSGTRSAC